MKEDRHSILVNGRAREASLEIIRWGEALWWPSRSLMRFVRLGENPVRTGTRYRQQVLLPFAPSWDVEVEEITQESITRRFLNGMFRGKETVSLRPSGAALEISYAMTYEVRGFVNKILWRLIFRRLHDRNIEEILANLKKYLEKRE